MFSLITVPSQPNIMNVSPARPSSSTVLPASEPFSHSAPPSAMTNMETDATAGQGLPCGT